MPLSSVLLLAIPLLYLAAALVPDALVGGSVRRRWSLALSVVSLPPLLAAGATVILATGGPIIGQAVLPGLSVRLDATTVLMLLLVTSIAALILRFSRRYLDGEPGQARYVRWFLATMAAAALLVVTNNLLTLGLAWLASSLAMHQLLTFYDERPQAQIAAHKKFLLGRLADVAIFAGIMLVARAMGTLEIDAILTQAAALETLPTSVHVAGALLAIGVVVRAAQLPWHGWLIQVMEAPTPVSALLHAGIVNIGGFVLIRLSGLMVRLDGAQMILASAGALTAVLAALVMTTRVSIKVSLAWSTCAQMGFMLLECGLGAYGLALLHLLAHSLYKAHAFLASGRAVEQHIVRSMTPASRPDSVLRWVLAAALGIAIVGGVGMAAGLRLEDDSSLAALGLILALSLAPMLLRASAGSPAQALKLGASAAGIVVLYAGWHALFERVIPTAHANSSLDMLRSGFVAAVFVTLYLVQMTISAKPSGRLARALYPACFAGFYLDEIMTRLTFQFWPPRPRAAAPASLRVTPPLVMERAV